MVLDEKKAEQVFAEVKIQEEPAFILSMGMMKCWDLRFHAWLILCI